MRSATVALALFALVGCGQPAPIDAGPAMPEALDPTRLELSCAAFADLTPATLAERFGAENITTETLLGPEGTSYEATIVYPNDLTRRAEIIWTTAGSAIDSILVSTPETQWRGPGGVTVGTSLADVERANGRPFSLYGFDWDYGGWVSNWRGGALDGDCRVRVRFDPGENAPMNVSGDSEFSSDSAEMRAANATVRVVGLIFIRPE
ncbi:MAG: hypothetical protein AB7H66_10365 [Hyphomonadaceae bacterium]